MKKGKIQNRITRREALKKTGKYAAATAAATFILLNPKQSQASSPAPPGWSKSSIRNKGQYTADDASKA